MATANVRYGQGARFGETTLQLRLFDNLRARCTTRLSTILNLALPPARNTGGNVALQRVEHTQHAPFQRHRG